VKKDSRTAFAGLLLAASLAAASSALAQDGGGGRRQAPDTTPLGEPSVSGIIKTFSLIESKQPARVFIKGWHKPKKVIVLVDNNVHRLDWMKEAVPADVELVGLTRDDPRLATELKTADAEIGMCSKEIAAAAGPDFHWIHNTGVGVDQCFTGDVPARFKNSDIAVTNSARLEGNSVADHAIALMMALSRGLDQYVRMDDTKKFTTEPYPRMWSLPGRTILIAGLGGVGTAMANMAHGLGMHVIVTNATIPPNPPDFIEHIGLPDELGTMVGQADVVMTALPLTTQTANLFNAAMFAKFKKGAMFINVTRDEEQVDNDVVAALQSGQLSSAAFDYIPNDSPLYGVKNVIITPHVAAQNVDDMVSRDGEQIWAIARENLRRYVNGDKLLSLVDPAAGY
jgi:phosphoglycerate dehydrogenase-like enzyme